MDQGVIVLGELRAPSPPPSAAGEENVSSNPSATEDDGDAAKKRLVGLAGCPVLLLASQADAAVAGNDDHDAGLRSRLTGGGEYLATPGDRHLFCEFAAVSAPDLPSVAPDCPTHLLALKLTETETEKGGKAT